MNDINLLYVAIDAMAFTLIGLLDLRLMTQTSNTQLQFLIAWVTIGIMCNIVASRHDYGVLIDEAFRLDLGGWHPYFNLVRNSTAGAVLLACHFIFRDGNRPPKLLLALWILQVFLEEPAAWILGYGWHQTIETLIYEAIPAILQGTFLATALYWILSNREQDLITARRTARIVIVVVFSTQAIVSLMVERIAFNFEWIHWQYHYPIHVFVTFLAIPLNGALLFASFSPNTALVLGGRKEPLAAAATTELIAQDDADAGRIRAALEEEYIYRTPGLSVHGLAEHLAIPEYRLRNLVHEHLGFRNFNTLLHHYRVAEVCQALEDPQQNTTPVLTLALTAGYQSINPFNRAFREIHGVTPTAYRKQKQHQVDS